MFHSLHKKIGMQRLIKIEVQDFKIFKGSASIIFANLYPWSSILYLEALRGNHFLLHKARAKTCDIAEAHKQVNHRK